MAGLCARVELVALGFCVVNARNASIIEARAAGRPLQSIALEHGLSVSRVSKIVQDHAKDLEIARLREEVRLLRAQRMMDDIRIEKLTTREHLAR